MDFLSKYVNLTLLVSKQSYVGLSKKNVKIFVFVLVAVQVFMTPTSSPPNLINCNRLDRLPSFLTFLYF